MDDRFEPAIGIIGLGFMGDRHTGNIHDLGYRVSAGADSDPAARKQYAQAHDVQTYSSHEEMFHEEDLDGVIVATPNHTHEPLVVDAMDAGYDVLCEKPLAHSVDGAENIASAVDSSDGFCMTGFHNRFTTSANLFKSYYEDDYFGEITHVQADLLRRRGIPGPGTWFTTKEKSGGGCLIDMGVHLIDFILYLLEFPEVVEISSSVRSEFGGRDDYSDPDHFNTIWEEESDVFDVEDSASIFMRCEDGTTISIENGWAVNWEPHEQIRIHGNKAGATCALGGDTLNVYDSRTKGVDHYGNFEFDGDLQPKSHKAEVQYFIDHIQEGRTPDLNTVEQGMTIQRIVDGIYRSSEKDRAVSF